MDQTGVHDIHQHLRYHIMLIDDDKAVLENMQIYLSDSGYDVSTANKGTLAIETFDDIKPDLIFCDLRMPDIDGLKLIESFSREKPDLPIIVISGAGHIQDVVEALRLGAADFLLKPIIDFKVFDSIIESALIQKNQKPKNHQYDQDLESAHQELAENLQVLDSDFAAGKLAQVQLLPEPEAKIGKYTFQQTIIPGAKLGCDFLDYFQIDHQYMGCYIADLSALGDGSAFAAMLLKSLFNHPLRQYRITGEDTILNPAKLLEYLNQQIIEANVGKNITIFYTVIDRQNDSLIYSLGGHYPKPLLLNGNKQIPLADEGFPVGLFDWVKYKQYHLKLNSPFTLGMFSIGLLEVLGNEGEDNNQNVLDLIGLDHDACVSDIVKKLRLSSNKKPTTDITVFLVKYRQ